MKNFTKGQMAMLAASRGLEPCESLYSMAMFKKARTIFEFAPLLVDGVLEGRHQFEAMYHAKKWTRPANPRPTNIAPRQEGHAISQASTC